MDPDPAIFVIDLQDANKKLPYLLTYLLIIILKITVMIIIRLTELTSSELYV